MPIYVTTRDLEFLGKKYKLGDYLPCPSAELIASGAVRWVCSVPDDNGSPEQILLTDSSSDVSVLTENAKS